MATQKAIIETYLRGTGKTLSSAQALETFKIKNLRARVWDLRNVGLIVNNVVTPTGTRAYTMSRRDHSGSAAKIFS